MLIKTSHRKRYRMYGIGVDLFCGNKVIMPGHGNRFSNFQISDCPECGMFVQTTGDSPETDRIQELSNDQIFL